MNEDTMNMEIRQFLKKVGVTSQRELEHKILQAVNSGKLTGSEALPVKMTLELPELEIHHVIEGVIHIE